ncbi:hypothetical protein CDD82_7395 [Ophiocordyceps australis]|uniref:Metallo-beta-lactamase domain-containing protein n=1 Tax=Ophiocordyceps australis TaxID=1399860 RepID=A0A2C5XEZ9_9HYPO|nr:hypothetical protein CDD82_7395 [Ophiocordyceps australis]
MSLSTQRDLPEARDEHGFIKLHTFGSGLMKAQADIVIENDRGTIIFNSWRHLIIHKPSNTVLWFDLGISNHLTDYPPATQQLQHFFNTEAAPNSILDDAKSVGVDPNHVNYIIASHGHWDHIFPVASYFPKAKFICGPGALKFAEKTWPDYPDSTFDGRIWNPAKSELPIQELPDPKTAPGKWQRIGLFEHGHDFFGDGSFWIINSPGHCPGNLSILLRTKDKHGKTRWIILAGDCMHSYDLLYSPEAPFGRNLPFLPNGSFHENEAEARDIIRKMAAMHKTYGDELLVWPAHVDKLEQIWEFDR